MIHCTKGSGITYTDAWDKPTQLTPAEVAFFQEAATAAQAATGISIDIWPRDHEEVEGPGNALGIYYCHMDDPTDEFITIDNYYIHERFMAECEGYPWIIVPETLMETICHELAHTKYRRHTKHHAAYTQQLLAMVNAATTTANGGIPA